MIQSPTDYLRLLGLKVTPWAGERWPVGGSYDGFDELSEELGRGFKRGFSGDEKIVGFSDEYPVVVKIPGDPDHQAWEAGVQSIFEEYHASKYGLAEKFVMAESLLYLHESGIPVLLQEKLTNLTVKVPEELGRELSWLPESWWSYAQIGQRENGDWRIYDLDAGSSCDFYPEAADFMEEFSRTYYERGNM